MGNYPGFVTGAVVGVAFCEKCKAVGTIVDMGLCCWVAVMVAKGPLWDVPAHQARRRTCKRPHGKNKSPRE